MNRKVKQTTKKVVGEFASWKPEAEGILKPRGVQSFPAWILANHRFDQKDFLPEGFNAEFIGNTLRLSNGEVSIEYPRDSRIWRFWLGKREELWIFRGLPLALERRVKVGNVWITTFEPAFVIEPKMRKITKYTFWQAGEIVAVERGRRIEVYKNVDKIYFIDGVVEGELLWTAENLPWDHPLIRFINHSR
jgi:hypothetical protein